MVFRDESSSYGWVSYLDFERIGCLFDGKVEAFGLLASLRCILNEH